MYSRSRPQYRIVAGALSSEIPIGCPGVFGWPQTGIVSLYKMADEILLVTLEHVDDGNLDHRVASGLLAHGSAGHVDEYLTGEGRIVDAHVELQALVLRLSAHALPDQIDAMAHVAHVVNRCHLEHVGLVAGEIGVGLDGLRDLFQ